VHLQALKAVLPITLKAYNARWTGRETHTKIDIPNKPPRENQILNAGIGDVIYACEWSDRDVTRLRSNRLVLRRRPRSRDAFQGPLC
jgi:hypothetical protein